MGTTSIESSSPSTSLHQLQESDSLVGFPQMSSPSSDKRFWSTLRTRVDTILQNRNPTIDQDVESTEGVKLLKKDSALLLQGFDSVAQTLSLLSSNLENAMQRARDLSGPPTLTEMLQCNLEKTKNDEQQPQNIDKAEAADEENIDGKRGLKRKLDPEESSDNDVKEDASNSKELVKIKKAKNIAISMATKAAVLARDLKSIKSDLCFMQERCTLLEEENRQLRVGFSKGLRPEEDDLVRLQLEALLAEKSRLANENANLVRENRCLHQLVEYHQLTSQDLSASYENLIRGMCLDFSSPPLPTSGDGNNEVGAEVPQTPREETVGLCKLLDEYYDDQ